MPHGGFLAFQRFKCINYYGTLKKSCILKSLKTWLTTTLGVCFNIIKTAIKVIFRLLFKKKLFWPLYQYLICISNHEDLWYLPSGPVYLFTRRQYRIYVISTSLERQYLSPQMKMMQSPSFKFNMRIQEFTYNSVCNLIYKHECFTREYTTHKLHTKPHRGLGWHIFQILTSVNISMISLLSLISILSSELYLVGV